MLHPCTPVCVAMPISLHVRKNAQRCATSPPASIVVDSSAVQRRRLPKQRQGLQSLASSHHVVSASQPSATSAASPLAQRLPLARHYCRTPTAPAPTVRCRAQPAPTLDARHCAPPHATVSRVRAASLPHEPPVARSPCRRLSHPCLRPTRATWPLATRCYLHPEALAITTFVNRGKGKPKQADST